MAALDFPAAPAPGDTYSAAGRTWTWNGESWRSTASATERSRPGLGVISTGHYECLMDGLMDSSGPSSQPWPAANRALFLPFEVVDALIATQMGVYNGGTIAGNVDLGIYASDGTRLVSTGSQTRSGASAIQVYDITDTLLATGVYYLALSANNNTDGFFRWGTMSTLWMRANGIQEMDSAFALPSTATFANPSAAFIPWIGLTTRAVF